MLHERGIDISHETVRAWWGRFGPMFAAEIRKKCVSAHRSWSEWRWLSFPKTSSVAETLPFRQKPDSVSGMYAMVLLPLLSALRDTFRGRAVLQLELLALRHQLATMKRKSPRPSLRPTDRLPMTALSDKIKPVSTTL